MPKKSNKNTLDLVNMENEKLLKEKELDERFAMIQKELEKQEIENQQEIQEPKPSKRTPKKKKKIIEEIIEEPEPEPEPEPEEEQSSSDEEIVVRRIYKRAPALKPKQPTQPPPKLKREQSNRIIEKSNLELLRNDFNRQMRERLMSSLFDY